MAQVVQYKYILKNISWIYNGVETPIIPESVKTIIFNYDYDNANRPIIYININIKSSLYNKMRLYKDYSKILLVLYKYNIKEENAAKIVDIKGQFDYIIPNSDKDYTEDLTKQSDTEEESYRSIVIGLIQSESLRNNNSPVSSIWFKKIDKAELLLYGLPENKKICIETFQNNEKYDVILVPPMKRVSEYIKYINDYAGDIYDGGYRFFDDFDMLYVLSQNGNYVPNGSTDYSTVIVDIKSLLDDVAINNGMVKDSSTESYLIYVDGSDISFNDNEGLHSMDINNYTLVNNDGSVTYVNVNSDNTIARYNGSDYKRTFDNEAHTGSSTKSDVERYNTVLTFSKAQIDPSLITPNKEYQLHCYKEYSKYDGKYILSRKQVNLVIENGEYIPTTSVTLRKIVNKPKRV